MQDNTIVDLSSLSHLNDESNILIKIRDANSLQEKEWLSKSTVDHWPGSVLWFTSKISF